MSSTSSHHAETPSPATLHGAKGSFGPARTKKNNDGGKHSSGSPPDSTATEPRSSPCAVQRRRPARNILGLRVVQARKAEVAPMSWTISWTNSKGWSLLRVLLVLGRRRDDDVIGVFANDFVRCMTYGRLHIMGSQPSTPGNRGKPICLK